MKKKSLNLFLIPLSFTFIYFISTAVYFVGIYRSALFFSDVDLLFEGAFYLLSIPGILLVSSILKNKYSKKRYFVTYSVSLLLNIVFSFLLFLPLNKALFTAILLISFIVSGCAQGAYILLIVLHVPKSKRCFTFGLAASLSVALNALVSLIDEGEFVQSSRSVIAYLIIAVVACCLLHFSLFKLPDTDIQPALELEPSGSSPAWNAKSFIVTCLFITLSWLIQSLGFFFPVNSGLLLGISNEALRITNIIGLIAGGYILDCDKKVGAITSLLILATPMLYIFLQANTGITLVVFLLSYLFTGFLSIYRMGIIADLSERTNSAGSSMIWLCTFGLIFGRLGEGLGGILGIKLSGNTLLLLTVTCFVLVIAVAFFIFHYEALFVPVPQITQKYEEKIASFKIEYNLSNREIDVLEFLLDGDSNSEIAGKLYVSENTVRFHVSNILKKTSCKNRKEVFEAFHKI